MGALTNKDVHITVLNYGSFMGTVILESENYLLIRTKNGETNAFPWASIARIEVIRVK
jgi:hypothetical protein